MAINDALSIFDTCCQEQINVEGVNVEGISPAFSPLVTTFVQNAINQRVNPITQVDPSGNPLTSFGGPDPAHFSYGGLGGSVRGIGGANRDRNQGRHRATCEPAQTQPKFTDAPHSGADYPLDGHCETQMVSCGFPVGTLRGPGGRNCS